MLSQEVPFPRKAGQSSNDSVGPVLPPAMENVRSYTADEVVQMLNRTPLFMTTLDETDGEGGENIELAALRALAYDGTRAEIAGNFREQGNEQARIKRWKDAKEFYDKALAALKAPQQDDPEPGEDAVELDEEEEAKKEKVIEEASYVNRALCNLELRNYRSCNLDCAATLRLNISNVKAWYRSASACLALDRIPEAEDACNRGLEVDSENDSLRSLSTKIKMRKQSLENLELRRQAREARQRLEEATLAAALKRRGIRCRTTDKAPDAGDAIVKLADPVDADSTLFVPVVLLYSAHLHSDFIKAFDETQKLNDHLEYIFPLPWDEASEYTVAGVECYMETIAGGLIKAGKKLPLSKILVSGKVEIVDGLVKVHVLPKSRVAEWIEEYKLKRGKT
ncbi:TPR repeat protein-like protein [Tothia fuscella]|uniref:TPR repeat protein-like protein n=1 Tax=Tothia fuscella TaxID=1048955 RepID=A0A9P4NE77_9PEZI|nr:TPR repeat protein-like protein [Tothia fuscella]